MKKLSALLSFLILFTAFNCDDEPLDGDFVIDDGIDTTISCEEAIQNTGTATTIFASVTPDDVNYTQLCLVYQNALQDQIDACGDDDGTLQAILNALGNCGLSQCEIAIIETDNAEIAYNNDTTNVELCNAYKSALQDQITACGDVDGSLQGIIDVLGDCTSNSTSASIIGTWELIAYTSNGEEFPESCLGDIEIYTATTYQYGEVWGDNCENLNEDDTPESYTLDGNQLTVFDIGESETYEILELTEITLKYQDVYTEFGTDYTDIYTYERQ